MKKYLLASMGFILSAPMSLLSAAPSVTVPTLQPTRVTCTLSYSTPVMVYVDRPGAGKRSSTTCKSGDLQVGIEQHNPEDRDLYTSYLYCATPIITCVETP